MRTFDDTTGRLLKAKIENSISLAYTRYDYANTGNAVTSYSTIIDVNGDNSINTSDEVATESVFDGAGRLLKTRSANPNSTGGYTGKKVEYDILGRAYRETVPTEMNSSWNPAGDDYRSNTWLWNTREFDWKGRVTRTIPSDSTGSDGKDTLMSYEGCGCAGGMITTIQGPVTTAKDVGGTLQTTKRRVQKVYADILGRTAKTEVWDLDGAGSTPYSTTVTTFNGRDQLTLVREYSGGTSSGTYQDTTMSYDGHGRLKELHKPEWFDGSTLKYSTTTYNADDTPATVTDPRGTVTTYSYGNTSLAEKRAVLLGISYTVPSGSGIPVPGNVAFEYDAAGNRTSMDTTDVSEVTYSYDELSRLKTETTDFDNTLADAPSGGVYTLRYNYHLTGGLKSIKDPWNNEVTYASDSIGRTTSIGANSFDGRSNSSTAFASGLSYRAFGGIKAMNYATEDITAISLEFDNALRPTSYTSTSAANNDDIQDRNYTYYNDGMTHTVDNAVDGKYSQMYEYDFAGRVTKNDFGESGTTVPYHQNIGYDAFNHIASRQTWDKDGTQRSFTAGYTNNRRSSGGYQSGTNSYDFSGNTTQNNLGYNNKIDWKFDAVGRMAEWLETRPYASVARDEGATVTFDGDGRSVKKLKRSRDRNITSNWTEETEYSIFSTVLGSVITTADTTGKKTKTNVYMGKSLIAEQTIYQSAATIIFKNYDPVTQSLMETDSDGVKGTVSETGGHVELEALGAWVNAPAEEVVTPSGNYKNHGRIDRPDYGCEYDGSPMDCNVRAMLANYEEQFKECKNNLLGFCFIERDIWPSSFPKPTWADNVDQNTPGIILQETGSFRSGDTRVSIYGWVVDPSQSRRIGGPNESPEPPPPSVKSDCLLFVTEIAEITESKLESFSARIQIGGVFGKMAYDLYGADQVEVTGFKQNLVDGGQRSDVKRHILASASSLLLDGIGLAATVDNKRQLFGNWWDGGVRPKERVASLEGNYTGLDVGNLVASRIMGLISPTQLVSKLSETLCARVKEGSGVKQ